MACEAGAAAEAALGAEDVNRGGEPTYRYSLLDGVRDGFLINPVVVDARTDVTTQLLSDQGYAAVVISEAADGEKTSEQSFKQTSFEKKFFSAATNRLFCETLLGHGLRDPISGEFGKTPPTTNCATSSKPGGSPA